MSNPVQTEACYSGFPACEKDKALALSGVHGDERRSKEAIVFVFSNFANGSWQGPSKKHVKYETW